MDTRRSVEGLQKNLQHNQHRRFTAASIFNDDYLALASDDDGPFSILIYQLDNLNLINILPGHLAPIFQILGVGERIVSRDKNGVIMLWD